MQALVLATVDPVGEGPIRRRPLKAVHSARIAPPETGHLARGLSANGDRQESEKERQNGKNGDATCRAVAHDRPPPATWERPTARSLPRKSGQ